MEQVRAARRRRWADAGAPGPGGPWSMGDRWPLLVSVLADEQSELLRAIQACDLQALQGGEALQALRAACERVQRTTRRAQQIARLASGRVRQFRERIDLADLVLAVLADLGIPSGSGGPVSELDLQPAEAFIDPAVAYTVVECLLGWLLVHGRELTLQTVPGRGAGGPVLTASIERTAPPPAASGLPRRRRLDDGLELLLLQQAVWANGLTLRVLAGRDITARVGFPPPAAGAHDFGRLEMRAPEPGTDGIG
ncbi:hypothetical protein [Ramlibacter sp.]|uniref:hypothetical protein n=1 Tax=Ramlibacter sp. TaxID=1917967 RepID=UPI002D57FB51|nr:hypothetical protein [Ramlibacter sp.]HYD76817.1 hypothetical protein [Ramlibacter sp.]